MYDYMTKARRGRGLVRHTQAPGRMAASTRPWPLPGRHTSHPRLHSPFPNPNPNPHAQELPALLASSFAAQLDTSVASITGKRSRTNLRGCRMMSHPVMHCVHVPRPHALVLYTPFIAPSQATLWAVTVHWSLGCATRA